MPQPRPRLSIVVHRMKAGGLVIEWRRKGSLILDAGGVMAAAVLVPRDVMVVCLWARF